ncbi:putative fatty acyl-CoA reductase CG5065 [Choristoneura fumiferana]|uniref:putative fatty acyl-CoA reductase CG5065 n=1 Tax=Choristoneura fumiferana TaxID=7141 RepID=UPI003D15CD5E
MSPDRCSLSVADFYSGKSVFITGGTGFLGKVLIEKLLYSCKDIDKIYVLVRKSVEPLINSPAFTRLKAERPQDMTKIIAVVGDLCLPNLGINVEDEANLLENVSIVFHSAATVKFNAPLREAMRTNVEGTGLVLELSRRMKKLEVFIHVSSAYAQLDKLVVEEVVYPPPAKLEDVYELLDKHEHDVKKVSKLLKGFPNTYTFSKALAETLLVERRARIPLVILRPSVATAKGWIRVVQGRESVVADLIPVDYVTNMAILAASQCAGCKQVQVFNCCSGTVNPVTWLQADRFYIEEAKKDGFNDLACIFLCMVQHASVQKLMSFFIETLPAYFLDLLRILGRQSPRYIRSISKLANLRNELRVFTSTTWQFRCERALALATTQPAAAGPFPCCARDIQWRPYLAACHRGVVAYLFNRNGNVNAGGTYRRLDV